MNPIIHYTIMYLEVLGVFVCSYFLVCGLAWRILYSGKNEQMQSHKIQVRMPVRKSIQREIKWSMISMFVQAFMTVILLICIGKGYTKIYFNIGEHSWIYFIVSILLSFVIHDAYFYWMHRFMHLKAIFPVVHKIHHLSKTPSPWAIYAFHPVENIIDYSIFPILVFFVPLHPYALAFVIVYNMIMNLGGHFGFEFLPAKYFNTWLFKYGLTTTHHDMHHAKVNCNYGLYFNIWDRLMKTNHPEYEKTFLKVQEQIQGVVRMKAIKNPEPIMVPKFASKDTDGLYKELCSRIDSYFRNKGCSRKGGNEILIKIAMIGVLYAGTYGMMLSNRFSMGGTLFFAIVFGLTNVLIVFNIAHDAAHQALFKNSKANHIFSYGFNLVGTNGYLWGITHNQIHHSFPNVADYDLDIHQQSPLIRISPTVPKKKFHRFQPYYAGFLYIITSLFIIFKKDFQEFDLLAKKDSKLLINRKHKPLQYFIFFLSKTIYWSVTILIPFLVINVQWWQFLIGFLIVHFCMGLLLATVLIPVHMVDEAPFAFEVDNRIEDSWVLHVLKNTIDYSRNSKLANFFFGGLNTHLVHHLFPGICHIHYIDLSEILKQTVSDFGYEYRSVSMAQAIASHFRLLKRMS